MKASCGKRSCSYFTGKSDSIEPSAAHNILLRPRIGDTAGLLLSVIHQYKFFKYKKVNMHFFLLWLFYVLHLPFPPPPLIFLGEKKNPFARSFSSSNFWNFAFHLLWIFKREKKGYFNDFPGDSDTYTPYHFQLCFKMPVFFKVIGIPKQWSC